MIVLLATALFFIAVLLQMLGYTGTCTQGASGPFMTGATLSAPLLAAILYLLVLTGHRLRRDSATAGAPLACAGALALTPLALWTLVANLGVARDTLLLGTTPCGAEYGFYAEPFEAGHLFIGVTYGVGPAVVAVTAAIVAWLALPSRNYRRSA